MLSILTLLLSNRLQHVMVDGCWSILVIVVSGVPKSIVLGQLLFHLYTSNLFAIPEMLISCSDDSTLMAVVTYPGNRVTVTEPLNHHFGRISGNEI